MKIRELISKNKNFLAGTSLAVLSSGLLYAGGFADKSLHLAGGYALGEGSRYVAVKNNPKYINLLYSPNSLRLFQAAAFVGVAVLFEILERYGPFPGLIRNVGLGTVDMTFNGGLQDVYATIGGGIISIASRWNSERI